ncbi:hypothetical protein CIC12_20265 [Burkholderia sp. SG-MS1]|uniref:hypothetical protein n=1 Tax=Paraburkholderia sp. SG-MS1 TaxID=2023741 RepID=UPI001448741F|nr:hypothetical protein [Paraburkholderia sp. SG-MS1]NKJ49027.1 hypothetical protein [Paraburkholderia sp. SG-MS1]
MVTAVLSRSAVAAAFFLALGIFGEFLHLKFYGFIGDASLESFAVDWCGMMLVAIALVGLFYATACTVAAKAASRCHVQFWGFVGGIAALVFVTCA